MQAQSPGFDVASLRPDTSDNEPSVQFTPGRLKIQGLSLRQMIAIAYKIPGFRLSGGPSWTESERYSLEGITDPTNGADSMFLMLRTLLEDRFRLRMHHETREGRVYLLTIAKGGPKLRVATCIPLDDNRMLERSRQTDAERGDECGRIGYRTNGADHTLDSEGAAIEDPSAPAFQSLAGQLSLVLDRPVVNRTGLDGIFEIHLHWISDQPQAFPTLTNATPAPSDGGGPSIFTAVREQLGLRLESASAPIDSLVIDSVEKPAGN